MSAGPQVSRHGSDRHIIVFSGLSKSSRHVAVLTMLGTEIGFVKIIAPFEKGLSLFPDNSLSGGMAMRTHGCRLYLWLLDGFMWRLSSVGSPNLPVRSEVATSAGDSKRFFALRTRFGSLDLRLVQIGNGKRFRIMANATGLPAGLYVACMYGPGIGSCK